ncbi:MAG TPA: hypothetical protein VLC46_14220, partial [Thermoanaerobaculia bacterium]|nr:hypothetical protein [Thermoanaerobaculia bacterium]
FIGSCLCSTLLSDGSSRQPPLRFASPSVPSTWAKDFHLLAIEHARHTLLPTGVLARRWFSVNILHLAQVNPPGEDARREQAGRLPYAFYVSICALCSAPE